jgi:branched-chain amino acid transport system substrate-binding protein
VRPSRSAAASVALAAALAACPGKGSDVVIGVVGPLSGPLSFVGEAQRRGAQIAADEINDRGGIGGRKVRLSVRDSSDRSRLVGLLRDLVAREHAVALVGPEVTTPVLGRSSPAARAGVAVLLPYAPLGDLTRTPGVFRLTPSDETQAAVLARWLVSDRRIRAVALAVSSDETGRGAAALLSGAIERAGGRVVATREFATNAPDQTPLAAQLARSGAGALVIWGNPADAARVVLAVRRTSWRPQLAGSIGLFVADFRSLAGEASDNTVFPLPFRRDWFSLRVAAWFLAYHQRFGIVTLPRQRTLIPDLPVLAMAAYDAVKIVAEAAGRVGTSPRKITSAIASGREFAGIGATYSFSQTDREAFAEGDLWAARFYNFAVVYDVDRRADRDEQIAFYKIQVSAFYVPPEFLRTAKGLELQQRVLEDVLTNPEQVEFFRPYSPPRPPPGPIAA